jgi:hypothetical protein
MMPLWLLAFPEIFNGSTKCLLSAEQSKRQCLRNTL